MLRLVIAGMLSLFCGHLFQSVSVAQAPEPGTYRVWICADPCTPADSAKAVATATIVILDDAAANAEPARGVLATLPVLASWRNKDTTPGPNACFRVTQRERRVGTEELFVGITPAASTRWQHSAADGFTLRLYQSPDASYALRWIGPGALTTGEGWSSGPGPSSVARGANHRNAYFAATRLGPPDPNQCK